VRKLIARALMSLVLDKKARQAWEKSREKRVAKDDRADAEKAAVAAAQQIVTEERKELIKNAIQVRRAKTQVLADLSDADRRKLYVAAVRAFLGKGPDAAGGNKPDGNKH
jgi:Fic family protein